MTRSGNRRVRPRLTSGPWRRVRLLDLLQHLNGGALGALLLAVERIIQGRLIVLVRVVKVGLGPREDVVVACLR